MLFHVCLHLIIPQLPSSHSTLLHELSSSPYTTHHHSPLIQHLFPLTHLPVHLSTPAIKLLSSTHQRSQVTYLLSKPTNLPSILFFKLQCSTQHHSTLSQLFSSFHPSLTTHQTPTKRHVQSLADIPTATPSSAPPSSKAL